MLSASQFRASDFLIATESRSCSSPSVALPPALYSSSERRRAIPKLLDSSLTAAKSTTSQFLIDNFCVLCPSHRAPASSIEPLASRTNRPYFALCNSRLLRGIPNHAHAEIAQTLLRHGPRLTGHCALSSGRSRLSTFDCKLSSLIENDMHSREESSACKQSTYHFLIENEFHSSPCRLSALPSTSRASFASWTSWPRTIDCRCIRKVAQFIFREEEA